MRLYLIAIIFLSAACSEVNEEVVSVERPANCIPFDSMPAIIADLNISEAHVAELRLIGLINKDSVDQIMGQTFGKHGVDANQFKGSVEYYASLPGQLDSIYKRAEKVLISREKGLSHIEYKEEKLTQLNRKLMKKILLHDTLKIYLNDSVQREPFKKDVMSYLRRDTVVLDSISFRQFAFTYNLMLGTERKFKLFKEELFKEIK